MTDKKKMKRTLILLQVIWERYSHWSFHQLITNLQYKYSEKHNGYGRRKVMSQNIETSYLDFFYLEDQEWNCFLHEVIEEKASLR